MSIRSLKRQRTLSKKLIIILIVIIFLIVGIFLLADYAIKPTIIAVSEAQVRYIATKAMHNSIQDIMGSNVSFTDLVSVSTDSNGKVTMIQANTITMNTLAALTSSAAQDEIREMGQQGIRVSIGTISGSRLLAGRGPKINVKMVPIGSVSTDFSTEFENAGINQTRHKIYLTMNARVRVIVPLGSEETIVNLKVPISETIIVGDVPNNYVYVEDEEDMLNLIPNLD